MGDIVVCLHVQMEARFRVLRNGKLGPLAMKLPPDEDGERDDEEYHQIVLCNVTDEIRFVIEEENSIPRAFLDAFQ